MILQTIAAARSEGVPAAPVLTLDQASGTGLILLR